MSQNSLYKKYASVRIYSVIILRVQGRRILSISSTDFLDQGACTVYILIKVVICFVFVVLWLLLLLFLQLLSGTSPTRSMTTPTSSLSHQIPTTPSSSRSSSWRKRGRTFDSDESSKRRRMTNSYPAKQTGSEKGHQGKGLRHFSQRVCEKVRQKGNTTYNEVCLSMVILGVLFLLFPKVAC